MAELRGVNYRTFILYLFVLFYLEQKILLHVLVSIFTCIFVQINCFNLTNPYIFPVSVNKNGCQKSKSTLDEKQFFFTYIFHPLSTPQHF